ncbi:MAG: phosphatidate cytidylyltransferase [Clostridia bacterium]|nr:phosphatidate cytidylyltransferase [Clostridia bacterium]
MKTRIISAVVGSVLLLGILFCPYTWVFVAAMAILAAIAAWELLYKTSIVNSRLFTAVSMSFAAAEVLAIGCACKYTALSVGGFYVAWLPYCVPPLYILTALVLVLVRRGKPSFVAALYGVGLTAYATLGFGGLAVLREASFGNLVVVLFAFVIPWMSDIGAYFTGMLFGKHKMAPIISPKKTWEGFFGGWVFSVACSALYAVICNAVYNGRLAFDPLEFALFALLLAPLSVCGDLFASLIKRRCGIKDYSNIMPGHGGVMDRFDSVVLTAPLLCAALMLGSMK